MTFTKVLKLRADDQVAARVLNELRLGMQRIADSPGIGHYRLDLLDDPFAFIVFTNT